MRYAYRTACLPCFLIGIKKLLSAKGTNMNIRCRTVVGTTLAALGWGALGWGAIPLAANADDSAAAQAQPVHELWLNPGFYSYHFQKDRNLNDNTAGFGAEYRFSEASALTGGFYHNSNWHTSHYAGYYWRPLAAGPVRFGAIVGAADGYPGTRHGNWFPVVLPTLGLEYGRIGLNVFYIPSYRNSINGSITFQLKLRVY